METSRKRRGRKISNSRRKKIKRKKLKKSQAVKMNKKGSVKRRVKKETTIFPWIRNLYQLRKMKICLIKNQRSVNLMKRWKTLKKRKNSQKLILSVRKEEIKKTKIRRKVEARSPILTYSKRIRTKQYLMMTRSKLKSRKKMIKKKKSKISKQILSVQMHKIRRRKPSKNSNKLKTLNKPNKVRQIRTEQIYYSRCPNSLKRDSSRNKSNKKNKSKSVIRRKMNKWKQWISLRWLTWKRRKISIKMSYKAELKSTYSTKKLNRCKANLQRISYQTMKQMRSK